MHTSPAQPVTPCCGLDTLVETLGGNHAIARNLARMFLENLEPTLDRLDQAVLASDLEAVRRLSHDIRGTCAVFAAEHCLRLARKIELDLGEQRLDDWRSDCRELRLALGTMAAELEGFVQQGDG